MRTREHPIVEAARKRAGPDAGAADLPLVTLSDITEIELLILRRMREFTIGEHRSLFHGSGFDFVGLRDWQAGDRFSSIDWPQSTLNNFSPLVVREFEQPSTAGVVVVADASLSTRCGLDGAPIGAVVARAIATVGMSTVFFQDLFGLIAFDAGFQNLGAVPPRIGKRHVVHCLDAYQYRLGLQDLTRTDSLSMTIAGFLRKTTLVPVVSDFLFDDVGEVIKELSLLNSEHDVVLVIADGAFAYTTPRLSAGWVEACDIETGRAALMSRGEFERLGRRIADWQDDVERQAKDADLDVLRLGMDHAHNSLALAEFVAERRLRKTTR